MGDSFTLITLSRFKKPEESVGKKIAILISLNWNLCISDPIEQIDPTQVGLPVTCHNKIFTHESYLRAICDFLSTQRFSGVEIILGGTLQAYSLAIAQGFSINNSVEMQKAHDKLFSLENIWINQYEQLIRSFFQKDDEFVRFVHWDELISGEDYRIQKCRFETLYLEDEEIRGEVIKESSAFWTRQDKVTQYDLAESHEYLKEEIPAIANSLSQRVQFAVYHNNIPLLQLALEKMQISGKFFAANPIKTTAQKLFNQQSRRNKLGKDVFRLQIEKGISCGRAVVELAVEQIRKKLYSRETTQELLLGEDAVKEQVHSIFPGFMNTCQKQLMIYLSCLEREGAKDDVMTEVVRTLLLSFVDAEKRLNEQSQTDCHKKKVCLKAVSLKLPRRSLSCSDSSFFNHSQELYAAQSSGQELQLFSNEKSQALVRNEFF